MAERRVNVKLDGDSRGYVSAANKAADATDDLRNKAERFSGKKYNASVGVDGAAKAAAEIADLRSRLQRVEGRYSASVNVNTRGAQRDVAMIMNSLFALGPAAVTAGAVAGGAMVALGSTLATVGAGIGVTMLAFNGVGEALKAMGDAEAAAGKNAIKGAQDRTTATRAIESARTSVVKAEQDQARAAQQGERDISDAKAKIAKASTDAAWANTKAAADVEKAEEDLVASHQKVRYALEELSFARSQAVRDLEDMKEATSDYALREEAAQIQLIEARTKLEALDRAGGASALDYRKARLDVLEAEDAVTDAQREGGRARIDLNSVEADGIEGMGNVVKARRNVQEAEAGVAASKADLITATAEQARTEREGSDKIASAVRDLQDARDTAAQRSADAALQVQESQVRLQQAVADASVKMGEQSTEAQKLAKEMGQLAPAGQAFAQYLYDLKPKMQELQALSQAGLFPGVEDGIDDLMLIFPDVAYMVDQMAKGLGDMARQAGDALNDPFWREFIRFLGDEAGPTFESFFKIGERVARGLAGVQMAFNPMAQDLIGGLEDMADRFAKWGTSLETSQGFQKFVAYVEENGPNVVATLGSIASMIGNIAEAAAPLGPVVLTVIKGLADTLGFIASVPGVGTTLLAVGTAFGALSLALRGMEVAKFSRVGQFLGAIPGQMGKAGDAAGMFALRMGASGEAAQGVADKTSRAARGIESAGKFALGAVVGVAAFTIAMDALSVSSDDAVTALGAGGVAAEQMRQKLEEQNPSIGENSAWWEKLNHNVNDWVYSLLGIGQSTTAVEADLAKQREAMTGVQRAQQDATKAQNDYQLALDRFGFASPEAVTAGENLRAKNKEVELQQIMAAEGVDRHTAALYRQRDAMMEATNASMSYDRAALSFEQAQVRATEATDKYGAESLEARDANLSLKESAVRAAESAGAKAEADGIAAGASNTAELKAQAQKDEYLRLAASTKEPLRSELLQLADQVSTLPDGDFKVTGTGEISLGATVQQALGGATGHIADVVGAARAATNRARGGVLPGYTPGRDVHSFYSPTAGFLNLSGGEGILRPEATRAIGGAAGLEGINRAARIGGTKGVGQYLGGGTQAFRDGGIFQAGVVPFTKIGTALHAGLTHGLIEGIAPQLDQQMANVAAMAGGGNGLAWAQTQAGKPYGWGAVGPSAYDCSGFMAAIMNVMDGMPPYRRRGTTATFPWPGMEPGMGPGLSVGNTRSVNGGAGHMAGTINGTNVESNGSDGVVVGKRARGAQDDLFNSIYHYVGTGNFVGSGAIEGGLAARNQVMAAASRYGWATGREWSALDALINKESSWNPNAANPTSTARGLFQKMTSIWGPIEETPGGQARWGLDYIRGRYGSPSAAWAFHQGHNYYDDGGVASGKGYMPKNVVAPERVLSPRQTVAFEQLVDVLARPRPVSYVPSPGAGAAGGSSRSVTIKNENHFRETVDLDLFNSRQEFAISSASF